MLNRIQINKLFVVTFAFAALVILAAGVSQAAIINHTPTGVLYSSGPSYDNLPDYTADKAIDGDLETFCCLWDDTLDGSSGSTKPINGAAPTTGYIIFDMGEVLDLMGVQLTSRDAVDPLNPKDVEFFYFTDGSPFDPGNSANIDVGSNPNLDWLSSVTFGGLLSGASETSNWTATSTRYVGMKVNSSYEEGSDGVHFNYQIAEIGFLTEAAEVPEPSAILLLFGAFVSASVLCRIRK